MRMKSHINAEIDTPRWVSKELITMSAVYTCKRWVLNEKYDHPLENRVGGGETMKTRIPII
jgi:hypothetical protein